jgi:nucleoside-diphosphate-sugar epimerase
MTILIFGGLGHVGSWITHDLVERGEDVAVFDMSVPSFDRLGYDYLVPLRDRIHLEDVDILDTHTLYERMRAYDIKAVIFGVAVIAGPNFQRRPFRHIEINTVGMLNVIEACRVLGVPKFVNMSSGAVYGDQSGRQTEDLPYKATDLYCATKISNEVLALQYGATYGIDVRNARLFAVYGPGKLPSRMHALYQVLFGPLEGLSHLSIASGGDQAMDWTHVRDSAQGVIRLLDAEGVSGQSFNISCGTAFYHKDILKNVRMIIGSDPGVTMGPGKFLNRGAPLDIEKSRKMLGFEPRFTEIGSGLSDYRDWLSAVA